MQLDKTRIAVRERGLLEILDLALRVIRVYAVPLAGALALGIVPAMLANAWLLQGLMPRSAEFDLPYGYMFWMLLLVVWQAPLATAPATLYLGQVLFLDRAQVGKMSRALLQSLPQMLWYQVLLRAPLTLVPLLLTWILPYAAWPYLSEVILLERNPWRRSGPKTMTTFRRARALHGGFLADLFARWLGSMAVGGLLFGSLWYSMAFLQYRLIEPTPGTDWQKIDHWGRLLFTLYYPLALWLVFGYFTVVRFLAYLDLRIRREGWEVELLMRAEAARLTRHLA